MFAVDEPAGSAPGREDRFDRCPVPRMDNIGPNLSNDAAERCELRAPAYFLFVHADHSSSPDGKGLLVTFLDRPHGADGVLESSWIKTCEQIRKPILQPAHSYIVDYM